MLKRFTGIITGILLISFLLPGCTTKTAETIKIGAIYPLSGDQAESGKDIQNGLLLAMEIINNKYDLNIPLAGSEGITSPDEARIEIVFADSQGSDVVAKAEAQKLIEQEHVVGLIGCYQSAVTAAASQVAEEKGIPFIADTSTAPSLTQRGFQWFFRTTPDDLTFVQNYFQFLSEIQQKSGTTFTRIGIVAEDSIFGSEFASYVQQNAPGNGYQVVENITYPSNTKNVDEEIQRLESAGPDIIMQASYTPDAVLFIQKYKQAGINPKAILTDDAGFNDPQFIQDSGNDGNFIFTRDLWTKDWASTNGLADSVNQIFRDNYQTDMTSDSARAFTAFMVLADAIQRAGSTTPSAVRDALLSTDYSAGSLIVPWSGVKFDPQTHQNTLAKGLISQIHNQEYRTVWPDNLATIDAVWPMPAWNARQ